MVTKTEISEKINEENCLNKFVTKKSLWKFFSIFGVFLLVGVLKVWSAQELSEKKVIPMVEKHENIIQKTCERTTVLEQKLLGVIEAVHELKIQQKENTEKILKAIYGK